MRILFTCWPGLGHLFPMLPLATAALRAGHEVVVASGVELRGVVEREGLEFWQVGQGFTEALARYRTDHPAGDIADMFVPSAAARAVDLVPLALEWQPDLVVHDVAEPAGAIAAAHTGARHAVHGHGLFPPEVWPRFAGPLAELFGRWRVPELTTDLLNQSYVDIVPKSLQPDGSAGFRRVLPLRPATVRADLPTPVELAGLPFPDTVYLSLGTVFNNAPRMFEAALADLITLPVNVIVTAGPGADPDVLGPQPPHVRITDYLPQAAVLPHCRLVVSHGGAGTMLGALAHGLPQLILPRGADNFGNAGAVCRAGAALAIPPELVTAGSVAEAAARLLTEPTFAVLARRIRDEIAAMPAPQDVLAELAGAGLAALD